jgi:hypothetical protein
MVATEIVDIIHRSYFHGMQQMGMKDCSLSDKINQIFITLTTTAIHYGLLAWTIGTFGVPIYFGLEGMAQHMCETRYINYPVSNPCTDTSSGIEVNFHSAVPAAHAEMTDDIHSMIH